MIEARQLSIFDVFPESPGYPDHHNITEAEVARIIGAALGVKFEQDRKFGGWRAQHGKTAISFEFDNYDMMDNHDQFLGCGYQRIGDPQHSGGAAPRDTIEEAVRYFREVMRK